MCPSSSFASGLSDSTKVMCTATGERKINDVWPGAAGYAFTRSPNVVDLSMAAMTSWRRTASAKSGTV